jgi:MFS transporter, FHS family, L-fucose permease
MTQQKNTQAVGMAFMGMIFFIFGFVTTFNITLADKFKAVFDLSNFQAQMVNGAFFFTYFLLSFASGSIIKKIGYKSGVILGLILVAIGSFLFFPAAKIPSFPFFLFAIFIMASGVVFLQVAANPYVTALGPSATASGRLNLTQALNSIATTLAPIIASIFIFKTVAESALNSALTPAQAAAQSVPVPFLIIGILVLIIAAVIFVLKLPVISTVGEQKKSIWKHPHVLLGALGIFFYVGAEVGSAALVQRYVQIADPGMSIANAAKMIALYWGGAMIGRFFASFMLSNVEKSKKYLYTLIVLILAFVVGWYVRGNVKDGFIFVGIAFINYLAMQLGSGKANKTLAVFAIIAAVLALATMLVPANLILWVGCSIGFFNSVMFPNIFALGVDGLDKGELSTASGIINTLIVGGAIIPVIMGAVADGFGVKYAFILPIICYSYITYYALVGSKHK